MLKKNSLLIWVIMIVLVLSACSSSNNNKANTAPTAKQPEKVAEPVKAPEPEKKEDVELRMAWWGSQERHDKTLAVIELFEKKYPYVTITGEYSGFDGYFDKLNTQLAAGNAPDLIQMGGNVKEYVDKGALLDLQPYVGAQLKVDDFQENFVKEATFDGKYYGVTLGVSQPALMYNTEVLKKAGVTIPTETWTWDDFAAISNQISKALGKGFYGSYDLSSKKEVLGFYLGATAGKEVYKDGQIKFDKTDLINWFTLWDGLRKSGAVVPAELQAANPMDAADKSLLVTGKVGFQSVSASQIFGYQQVTQDILGLITEPVGASGTGITAPLSGQFITAYAKTKNPEEVAMFMDFMVNDPEAASVLGNTRGVPGSAKIRDVLAAQSQPVDKVLYDYISLATSLVDPKLTYVQFPYDNEFVSLLQVTSEKIAFGAMPIDKAVDEFFAELDKIMSKVK
jgi:multiple sugar transport system substrate-binding protein